MVKIEHRDGWHYIGRGIPLQWSIAFDDEVWEAIKSEILSGVERVILSPGQQADPND